MKWVFIIAGIFLLIYVVLPRLSHGTTRIGLVAPGGGNGNAAQFVA